MALTQITTDGIKDGTITGTDLTTNVDLVDNQKLRFGTGNDLQIFHDGSDSYIKDSGTGKLRLLTDSFRVSNAADSENLIAAEENGSVSLFYDNSKKFETTSAGATVTGDLTATNDIIITGSGEFYGFDNSKIVLGHARDLQIYHDGTHNLLLCNNSLLIKNSANSESMIRATVNGNVELYYDNSKKLETRSDGIDVHGLIETNGKIQPNLNNTHDLGSTSLRWRNIYTNDLHLSNEGSSNDVDGTWGSYTIQEGAEDLFLVNKRSGKKYKFNLTEVA